MELSAEEFAEIVRHLGEATPPAGRAEQRRAARVERVSWVNILPVQNGAARAAVGVTVRNVSSRGLAFEREARMEAGRQFLIRLPRDAGPPVELLCTVVHVKEQGPGLWSHGAEFTCVSGGAAGVRAARPGDADEMARIRESILD